MYGIKFYALFLVVIFCPHT